MAWVLSAFADEAADNIDEQIEELRKAEIRYIDPRNMNGHNICDLPHDFAEEVAGKLEAAGIGVSMYGAPIGKIDIADDHEIDIKRLRHLGEMKKIFGANKVRIFSYYNKKNPVDDDAWQAASVERLMRLVEVAEELDLVLYHENELGIYGGTLEPVCALRDKVHAQAPDRFKLIFDFDNYNQNGDDVWEDWLVLRDATEAIHIKESKRQPDGECQHVPAGEGDGYIPEILKDLADRGWEGPLTLEPHLARSAGVVATGAHGQANQALADLSHGEVFQIAAKAARKILADVGRL